MNILNKRDVVKITGLSPVTIWRLERQGKFPSRINLSDFRVGWKDLEVYEWIDSRPRGICGKEVVKHD
jgi:prophage regulatory protein